MLGNGDITLVVDEPCALLDVGGYRARKELIQLGNDGAGVVSGAAGDRVLFRL
jgi:hypothetical protein